jgi:alpha-mannosidase
LIPGTATPKAFEFAWNDDVLAMNQFAGVMTSAVNGIAAGLDTEAKGQSIVVYNPLNVPREDLVEASLTFPNGLPAAVRVVGPDGNEVPAQLSNGKVLFLARMPSVGFGVYDVQPAPNGSSSSELRASESSLENARYRVAIDTHGDVASIFDKQMQRELLAAPIRLAISTDNPSRWPAWNMDFEDEQRAPRNFVSGDPKIRVVESGSARVTVEVERQTENSRFAQRISLSAGGARNRVEFSNVIDWKTKEANLKATFPLSAANGLATYNWDVGTIQRPNEAARQFEVASHQWIDLTDKSGGFGVTILTDCKNASDKPDDQTIRLTLIRTPGTRGGFLIRAHRILAVMKFCLASPDMRATGVNHRRTGRPTALINRSSPGKARAPRHTRKDFSLLKINNERIRVMALKKAELSDEVIVRAVEMDGRPAANVRITFPVQLLSAREVNGQEQPVGPATVANGELITSFSAYQPRTFAVKLAPPRTRVAPITFQPLAGLRNVSRVTYGSSGGWRL